MNLKDISKLIKNAKNMYSNSPERFNNVLNSNLNNNLDSNFNTISNTNQDSVSNNNSNFNRNFNNNNFGNNVPNNFNNNSDLVPNNNLNSNTQNNNQSNYGQNYSQQPNFNVPINVISKNYISPESFNEEVELNNSDSKIIRKNISLAKIPDNLLKKSSTGWTPINFRSVNDSYNLYELSKVEIKFDEKEQKLIYKIIEPKLSEKEQESLIELKKAFIYVFERFSPEFINVSKQDLIKKGVLNLSKKYNIKLNEEQLKNITYYLSRDFLGLEFIEPIMHDPFIEDISCDGLNIPIFVNHLKYGPLEVNREYSDPQKLNSFIVKIAQKSKQEVSLSKPILQGALPDGSRVEAIYGKEVSEKGSSFTIRKFREKPFTPIHLIELGTMSAFMLSYLWLSVENRQSLLVSGGTATGKTTILNALSMFMPPTSKIVSIEDTPEINLPHEHWLPMISRESEGKAEVSMFDLLKASLRERPDYIIVGEIRGKEAAILFQGMATGHAGLGTVHADKFSDLANRMSIEPISLPKQLLTELKIIVFMKQFKVKNNMVRRCSSIVELIDYDSRKDKFFTNEFVKFNPNDDSFEFQEKSAIMTKLIETKGGDEDSLWTEIEKRRRILDNMYKNKLLEFDVVSDIIKSYYKDPDSIFEYIKNFTKKNENESK